MHPSTWTMKLSSKNRTITNSKWANKDTKIELDCKNGVLY